MKTFTCMRRTHQFMLDLLYPITCIHCGTFGQWICDECFKKIPQKREQVCPLCERRITPDGQTCFQCLRKTSLDGMLVATDYTNAIVQSAIHHYKYQFLPDLHEPLGNLLLRSISDSHLQIPDMIIPVPLHPRRLRWRGFNQSHLLATHVGLRLLIQFPIPVCTDILIRERYTPSQKSITNHADRRMNITDAFSISSADKISGKRIILVDDVATTGSTLFECAKTLKKHGAKSVIAVVIARQQFNRAH